jgi:uncharacterized protein YecE (DUF72 family)
MIRVGPAGWSYPDWDGRVYPARKPPEFHPLAFLARFFDGIEVDSSFYAMPRREHAERWVSLVAEHPRFRFWVKLQREFTHVPAELDRDEGPWAERAREFRRGIDPLVRARRLGAILVQFPVSFVHGQVEVRRLGRIRSLFDGLPLVLEVRHASWFAPPGPDELRGLGYSLAYLDLPSAWNHPPDWHEPTGPLGYLRLHGRNSAQWFREGAGRDQRYDYLYAPEELEQVARRARDIARRHDETAVVTNNHFGGQAVANALELEALLSQQPPLAPQEIVESFPRLRGRVRVDGQQGLF